MDQTWVQQAAQSLIESQPGPAELAEIPTFYGQLKSLIYILVQLLHTCSGPRTQNTKDRGDEKNTFRQKLVSM